MKVLFTKTPQTDYPLTQMPISVSMQGYGGMGKEGHRYGFWCKLGSTPPSSTCGFNIPSSPQGLLRTSRLRRAKSRSGYGCYIFTSYLFSDGHFTYLSLIRIMLLDSKPGDHVVGYNLKSVIVDVACCPFFDYGNQDSRSCSPRSCNCTPNRFRGGMT